MIVHSLRRGLALLLLVVLAACSGLTPSPAEPTAQPTPPPVAIPTGGTVSIRLAADVGPLKPWAPASHEEEQIVGLLYRGLTRLDASYQPQPAIATAWTSDASGTALTMTLRTDVRWHDGTPLTAEDAAWTINTVSEFSPTTTLIADLAQVLVEATAPASDTLLIALREPYAPLLAMLSMPVLPKHIFGSRPPEQLEQTNFWNEAIGSGPFKLEDQSPGSAVTLVRNADDPDHVPFLDRLAFVVAPDPAVTSEALVSGELQAAELGWNTASVLSSTQTLSPPLSFGAYPENAFYFVAFNLRPERLFADERVRQALSLALDREALLELAGPSALPIASDHLPGSWAAPASTPALTPDREAAAALLNEAGWVLPEGATIRSSNGITLSAPLYVRGDDPRRVRVAERIANAASAVGIELVVTPADFETVIRTKLAPPFDFDIALMSWSSNRVSAGGPSYAAYDPDNFALFHSSQIYQGPADSRSGLRNFVGFSNPSFDNLSTAARALYDLERRQELYRQTNELLAQQLPYLPLWADRVPVALSGAIRSTNGPINLDTAQWLSDAPYWYLADQ